MIVLWPSNLLNEALGVLYFTNFWDAITKNSFIALYLNIFKPLQSIIDSLFFTYYFQYVFKIGSDVKDRFHCNNPQSDEIFSFFCVVAFAKSIVSFLFEIIQKIKQVRVQNWDPFLGVLKFRYLEGFKDGIF